jgi:hypothetical protein
VEALSRVQGHMEGNAALSMLLKKEEFLGSPWYNM